MTHLKKLALLAALCALLLAACGGTVADAPADEDAATQSAADLEAVKDYAREQAELMKAATADLEATAQTYYDTLASYDFDYEAAWDAEGDALAALIFTAREQWVEASTHYELDEGIVAGVPSLAYYDTWIDAGPSGEEDPAEAIGWQLELPDGTVLDSPGNFFHHLTEPTLWVTNPEFTAMATDLDGDGEIEFTEGLPEANIFLGATAGLDDATQEMLDAINEWVPTEEDAFTALVVMVPTMNEYFEQWKLSAYVAGNDTEEASFVAVSRLFDINGILTGLDFTYENVGVLVENEDPELFTQIDVGLDELLAYVQDLFQQEQAGKVFTAEEADLFGTEAQERATEIAGQVAQAAALLGIEIEE